MASTGNDIELVDLLRVMAMSMPAWELTLVAILSIVTFLGATYIWYSFGVVVATLAIIEDTSSTAAIRFTPLAQDIESADPLLHPETPSTKQAPQADSISADEDDEPVKGSGPSEPITSSIHGTFRHLERTDGSRTARMRAFGVCSVYTLFVHFLSVGMSLVLGHGLFADALSLLVVLCVLGVYNMTWTHMVISRARGVWHWKRMVWGNRALRLLWPTFIWAMAQVGIQLAMNVFATQAVLPFGIRVLTSTKDEAAHLLLLLIAISAGYLLLSNALVLLLYVPANIVLVRCQAAALSDKETPVIPFDRTFGGRVGADGYLGVKDAWTSFDWDARVRVGKVYLKACALLSLLAISSWFTSAGIGIIVSQS